MIDLYFRCFSRDRWVALATNRGILDAEGNPNPGFLVDELGHVTLAPATFDSEGNELTPANVDSWWTVNLRLYGDVFTNDVDDAAFPGETDQEELSRFRFLRSRLAKFVRNQATKITLRGMRAYQFGSGDNRVQLIDPRDVTIPPRIWADGMHL